MGRGRLYRQGAAVSHLRHYLGTPGCQAGAPLDFLPGIESDYLYLVGVTEPALANR